VRVDDLSLALYGLIFENRYLKAERDIFQELFAGIMERAHRNDFARVQPWGNKGALKCDGSLSSARMVHLPLSFLSRQPGRRPAR
jgi:hypothetical protein